MAAGVPIDANAVVAHGPSPLCGGAADQILVATGNATSQGADYPFSIVVP